MRNTLCRQRISRSINDVATKTDQTGAWELETAMDVEWAHALAPYANLILVEAANGLPNAAGVPTGGCSTRWAWRRACLVSRWSR